MDESRLHAGTLGPPLSLLAPPPPRRFLAVHRPACRSLTLGPSPRNDALRLPVGRRPSQAGSGRLVLLPNAPLAHPCLGPVKLYGAASAEVGQRSGSPTGASPRIRLSRPHWGERRCHRHNFWGGAEVSRLLMVLDLTIWLHRGTWHRWYRVASKSVLHSIEADPTLGDPLPSLGRFWDPPHSGRSSLETGFQTDTELGRRCRLLVWPPPLRPSCLSVGRSTFP